MMTQPLSSMSEKQTSTKLINYSKVENPTLETTFTIELRTEPCGADKSKIPIAVYWVAGQAKYLPLDRKSN